MATEAVVLEDFIKVRYSDSIRLCTEMVELTGDDAVGGSVDASVLAAVPVPEGSLIPIGHITAAVAQARGDADGRNTPRVALRVTCRDPRILGVVDAVDRLDPETRMERVFVWVFRVMDPFGDSLDHRFRARLRSVASLEGGSGWVHNVFLYSYDERPVVTRPEGGPARG